VSNYIAFAGDRTWKLCGTFEQATQWLSDVGFEGRVYVDAVKQQQEIERLRDFAERVYRDQFSPGWLHDRAAKLLDLPSLAHGCDDTEEEGR
jgi:hypothetical protein